MIHRRVTGTFSASVAALASVLVLLVLASGSVGAQTVDPFEVKGIKVDVTADSAVAARAKALAEGERRAFETLLSRLTLSQHWDRLPLLDAADVSTLVQDFSVVEEKQSTVRYLALLDFRFKRQGVRNLLRDYDVPISETPSKPVVVLAVYEARGTVTMWDDPNPWREVWATMPPPMGLVPMIMPIGDLADISGVRARDALKGNWNRLQTLTDRYGAGGVLTAYAVARAKGRRGGVGLDVYLTRNGPAGGARSVSLNFSSGSKETPEAMLARAVAASVQAVEDTWKQENLLEFGVENVIPVTVRIGGLADWILVKKRLVGTPVVSMVDLVLLSLDEARVNLHYLGEPEQLVVALEQASLTLYSEGEDWVLAPVAE